MKILITGGRSDIGFEIAKLYSQAGHECIVTSSTDDGIEDLKHRYEGLSNIRFLTFSLLNPTDNEENIENRIKNGVDALILNAATRISELKMFHEITPEEQKEEIGGNIQGNLWLLKKILPQMIKQNFGRLLLISSIAANVGTSRYGLYCLSKGALESLFLNLAVDYAKYNILSNILRPGIIKTERTKRFWSREGYERRLSRLIPQMTLGDPKQIAIATKVFLEIDSYTNGSVLNVGGGLPLTKTEGVF